jgi:hypothetical protein
MSNTVKIIVGIALAALLELLRTELNDLLETHDVSLEG